MHMNLGEKRFSGIFFLNSSMLNATRISSHFDFGVKSKQFLYIGRNLLEFLMNELIQEGQKLLQII